MNILTFFIILAMVITIGALFWGVGSMAHGGSYDDEHSEKLMFARVGLQAVAFTLIVLALALSVG